MWKCFRQRLSKRLGLLLFACMFFAAFGYTQNASAVVRVSAGVNLNMGGYDLLAEYGEWMRVPPYGVVWCPYVDESWTPFYDGRWIRTGGGWAWDSYEPFGELVYHYGYWYHEYDIGWFWVPGNEWSPARVQWYSYGNYCGWAPLPPPRYYWPDPWDYYDFNIWVVVHIDNFYDDHIGRHGIGRPHHRDVFQRDYAVKRAPDFRRVESVTHRQIPVQTIARRPMDIRTDRIKVAERSATRRDVQARGAVSENRTRVATPARSTGVERKAAVEKQRVQAERQVAKPTTPRQSERKVAASKQNAQTQRQVAKPTTPRQSERKVATPRQSTQPQRQEAASKRNAQSQRQAVKPTVPRQSERKVIAPRENSQPQRQAAASKQSTQPQRQAAASRQNTQVVRKAEAPARSSQRAQSRTAERKSDRATRVKAEK